jgi:hypothetical protein
MKINELLAEFTIFMSNEEQSIYDKLDDPTPLYTYTSREQTLIENLVRKSLVSKIRQNDLVLVVKNGQTLPSKRLTRSS